MVSTRLWNCYFQIDTSISVWVLPDDRDDSSTQMPEIGSDDPSVRCLTFASLTTFDTCFR